MCSEIVFQVKPSGPNRLSRLGPFFCMRSDPALEGVWGNGQSSVSGSSGF